MHGDQRPDAGRTDHHRLGLGQVQLFLENHQQVADHEDDQRRPADRVFGQAKGGRGSGLRGQRGGGKQQQRCRPGQHVSGQETKHGEEPSGFEAR